MKMTLSAACLVDLALCANAFAQLPSTLKIIVPFAPGGAADILARLTGEHIGRTRGISAIVENKPGASAIIGGEAVARAAPDGVTVGIVANSFLINSQIRKLSYDPFTSFEHICNLVDSPPVIVVNAKSPWRTLGDFVAAARAKPGEFSLGADGPATTQHVAAAMFTKTAGIELNFVPFQGGAPATNALLGSHVSSIIANYAEVAPQVEAGEMRIIATTSPTRVSVLPNVPTTREAGLDFDMSGWFAVVATGRTPAPVVASLIEAFSTAMKSPDLLSKFALSQLFPVNECGAGFTEFLRKQNEALGPIIKAAGIKVD